MITFLLVTLTAGPRNKTGDIMSAVMPSSYPRKHCTRNITHLLSKSLMLALFLIVLSSVPVEAAPFKDGKFTHIEYPGWFTKNSFHDLHEELQRGKAAGKKGMMIVFGAEGCSYCGKFVELSLYDDKIGKRVRDNLVAVGFDVFDDAEMTDPGGEQSAIKHFAKKQGAGFTPSLLFYDTHGKQIAKVVGYQSPQRFTALLDYVLERHYRNETLADHFRHHAARASSSAVKSPLRDDALFIKPPYALDRSRIAGSKPIVVLFEEPGCSECNDFHDDVLAKKQVRQTLERFEVVRINAGDDQTPVLTPDGKRVTPAAWYRQHGFTRVPALMFFNEKGEEVLQTDALVLKVRMMNSLNYVLQRAYLKGWNYQRFARSQAMERNRQKQKKNKTGSESN